ncbi:hypothetical protein I568_01205 [Enterococcus columbae DSM 7374 = ATCC 51263]|uniref:Sensor histidine kinase NatK-like C-terminal domain-containing protein n=1 Tax=Enterococcus columbae DSM 7374 = ATCC 51263 TaxID=1121865 RepID=S0KZ38_9ENTE|nr:hypothetical protein OMW_00607 [Enterococcus columbae DSM 7374 = ATCC 51263]EOW84709.1 hypothetical protein I568_01205 [Enterococcus columbae DSM 7374 = ATCC 51263]OJG25210.1 hypothetical protein RR47_GL001998 [Enterococcus columbae DSM 7374 = ATCC 51263]
MTVLFSFISSAVDIVLFSIISNKSLIKKIKKHNFIFSCLILIIGNINVLTNLLSNAYLIPFVNFICMTIFLLTLSVYLNNSFRDTVVLTILFMFCSLFSELISGGILSFVLSVDLLNLNFYSHLLLILINFLIKFIVILIIITIINNIQMWNITEILILLSSTTFSIVILIVYSYLLFIKNSSFSSTYHFVFFSVIVILLNLSTISQFYILKLLQNQRTEKENIEHEINTYKTVINDSIESQTVFESILHDFKNSIILIDKYVRNSEKTKALEYIQQFQSEITYIHEKQLHIYTTNEDLNYLLIAKKFYANSQNISMNIDCFLTDNSLISTDIIVVIIGNLIDNAINACINDDFTSEKYIRLKIKQVDDNLHIIVQNSIPSEVTEENLIDGIGIKNIKKIVNKNNGFYKRILRDCDYTVKIILWGKNNKLSNI